MAEATCGAPTGSIYCSRLSIHRRTPNRVFVVEDSRGRRIIAGTPRHLVSSCGVSSVGRARDMNVSRELKRVGVRKWAVYRDLGEGHSLRSHFCVPSLRLHCLFVPASPNVSAFPLSLPPLLLVY